MVLVAAAAAFPSASAAATHAEYIAAADPICRDAITDTKKPFKRLLESLKQVPADPAGLREFQRRFGNRALRIANRLSRMVGALAAMPQPAEDSALLNPWLALKREAVDDFADSSRAFKQGKFERSRKLSKRFERKNAEAARLIKGFGFQVCS